MIILHIFQYFIYGNITHILIFKQCKDMKNINTMVTNSQKKKLFSVRNFLMQSVDW